MTEYDNQLNDYECNSLHEDDTIFTEILKKKKKKSYELFAGVDKYGNDKYIYGSKGRGALICSAATGLRTTHKVGSADENLYFSVIDSRALNKEKEPFIFYFNSPEQFENLMIGAKIPHKTKAKWNDKYLSRKKEVEKNSIVER